MKPTAMNFWGLVVVTLKLGKNQVPIAATHSFCTNFVVFHMKPRAMNIWGLVVVSSDTEVGKQSGTHTCYSLLLHKCLCSMKPTAMNFWGLVVVTLKLGKNQDIRYP